MTSKGQKIQWNLVTWCKTRPLLKIFQSDVTADDIIFFNVLVIHRVQRTDVLLRRVIITSEHSSDSSTELIITVLHKSSLKISRFESLHQSLTYYTYNNICFTLYKYTTAIAEKHAVTRHCPISQKVACRILDGAIGSFHWLKHSVRTLAWGRLSL